MSSAAQVLKVAKAEIGVKENPYGSNKVKYNTEYYGSAVSGSAYPWCCAFVWWVFKHAGCPELFYGGKKTAGCTTLGNYYKNQGQTVAKNQGQDGDIILFQFDSDSYLDHVGIIEKRNSDGSYTTIEGNTGTGNDANGGAVMRRTRYPSQIGMIARPKYTGKSSTSTTSKPSSSTSSVVKTSNSKLTVDGAWGKNTTLKTQKVLGTGQDGIVSSQSKSCKKYLLNAETSSWQFVDNAKGSAMIKALQKLVGAGVDGLAGKGTVSAMQKFLNNKGFSCGAADGYMGKNTVMAWQKYINSRL